MWLIVDFAQEQRVKVKQHQRLQNGRLVTVDSFEATRRKKDQDHTGRNLLIGVGITAAVVGAGFLALKGVTGQVRSDIVKKSDEGIDAALKQIASKPTNTKPLKYPDSDIVIAVNGINEAALKNRETDDLNDVAIGLDRVLNSGKNKVNVQPFTVAYDLTGIDISKKPDMIRGFKTLQNLLYGKKTNDKTAELIQTVKAYQAQYPNKKITIVGFSMGGYVATNAAVKLNDPRIQTIVAGAPNIAKHQPPNYTAMMAKGENLIPGIARTGKEIVLTDADSHVATMSSEQALKILNKKLFGD